MRILMLGIPGIALKRPLNWSLQFGHKVWYIGEYDFYEKNPPKNYRFIPSILKTVKKQQNKSGGLNETEKEDLRPRQIEQLHQIVREFQPHVIHAHGLCYEVECCAKANIHPLIFSVWGFLNKVAFQTDYDFKLNTKLYLIMKAADTLIVEAPLLVEKCQALLQPCPRTELIPLGADTQHFRPYSEEEVDKARQLLRIPQQAKVLLSPRVWLPHYCHHEILEAFALAKLQLTHPTMLVFLLKIPQDNIDGSKSYYEYFRKRVKDLEISKYIYYLRQKPYKVMPFVYLLSDAIINFPKSDAFASTLIEASACAKPIITAQLPFYQNTFVEEFCTLVAPHDVPSLAAAIVKIVNQPEIERRKHLALLRQTIIEQYDERIMKQRLLTLYEELASVNN